MNVALCVHLQTDTHEATEPGERGGASLGRHRPGPQRADERRVKQTVTNERQSERDRKAEPEQSRDRRRDETRLNSGDGELRRTERDKRSQRSSDYRQAGGSARDHPQSHREGGASSRDHPQTLREGGACSRDHPQSHREGGASSRDHPQTHREGAASSRDHPQTGKESRGHVSSAVGREAERDEKRLNVGEEKAGAVRETEKQGDKRTDQRRDDDNEQLNVSDVTECTGPAADRLHTDTARATSSASKDKHGATTARQRLRYKVSPLSLSGWGRGRWALCLWVVCASCQH